jgi:hypothetical protein
MLETTATANTTEPSATPRLPRAQLTPKREAFVKAYLELGDASAAYRRAFHADGMKPASIHNEASRLLRNELVRARIGELQGEPREPTVAGVIAGLRRIVDTLQQQAGEVGALLREVEAQYAQGSIGRPTSSSTS